MFKKKQPPTQEGRNRRTVAPRAEQRGTVFSYANSRSVRAGAGVRNAVEQQQESLRRGPRFPWLKRVPVLVSLIAIGIVVFALLQLGNDPKVIPVGDPKGQVFLRDAATYEAAASQAFSPLLNGNKITVDTADIATTLKRQFPELAVVSVSLPIIGNQPLVYVQPAAPRLLLVTSQKGTFVLDGNGRALISGQQVAALKDLDVPVVTDQSNLPVELGKTVLPRSMVAFIQEVTGQLRAKKISITSLTLPAGTNELHVRLKGENYYVKFNLYGKAREEVGALLAMRDHLKKNGKVPGEYVDVRVENKVYYK